jgi:hypothetical protein
VRRRRTVEHWRRDVFASQDPKMTAAVKVLCLYLADHMSRDDHKVSLPRDKIARALGVHRARVAERLGKAVEARFLGHVSAGSPGRTAIYQATWPEAIGARNGYRSAGRIQGSEDAGMDTAPPDAISARRAVPIHRLTERESAGMDTALLDANTEADLSSGAHGPDVGNDEGTEDQPVRSDLTGCRWHGWEACPPDCANHAHTREEIA